MGQFASGKTSSEHRASLLRGRAEVLPQSFSAAAWRFLCSHTPDTAGPWITDPAGITLAFRGKKGLGDALQVGEIEAGMWETVRCELPVGVNLNRSH